MNDRYALYQTDTFVSDLKNLDPTTKGALRKSLSKILEDPLRFKPLKGRPAYHRIRIGVYRLIYKLDGTSIILLYFKKRDTVYERL